MTIRNVVFDIGNVLVRWDPMLIIKGAFGEGRADSDLVKSVFQDDGIWLSLNRGEITAAQAMTAYRDKQGFSEEETERLWHNILQSQILYEDSVELMRRLSQLDYRIFALSDNVHEIVAHLKSKFNFWHFFEGAVISAEVGILKPEKAIYDHLLQTHGLKADETLFLDDMPNNVVGARAVGINSFQFSTVSAAKEEMFRLGVDMS